MRKIILTAALMMAPAAAFAQTTSGATSQSNDQAIAVVEGAGSGVGNGNYGSEDMHESGHLYGTPSVGGSYAAFANPCGLSSSGSGAGGPIGLSFSAGYEGAGCTTRASTAGFLALGLQKAALARFCQDQGNADAYFAAYGIPCIGQQDKARYRVVADKHPVVVAAAAPAAAPVHTTHPAWCDTATPAERARYAVTCGG